MSARNVVLILMFGSVIYAAYYLYRSHTIQPLQADLITIDTNRISQLRIHPRDNSQKSIQLQREEDYWIASNGQVHLRALPTPVASILGNLVKITTVDIAAKEENDWLKYGLGTGQGVRVEVYEGNELVEDFWVGNTVDDPSGADSLSFIRIHEEQEVYAVRGLSTWPFRQTFIQFRPRKLLALSSETPVDSFAFQLPDTLLSFQRSGQEWRCNGAPIPDPSLVQRFLRDLRHIESTVFVDDYDYNLPESNKFNSLVLYLPQTEQPVLVDAYLDTLRELPIILHSNQNPTTWFGSDSSGVYSRLFWPVDSLMIN
ncbi:DUF4340 domain-containing protein [Flavilitoribacter nigricans]|uniref:DUF4340 domain-containing protein n=1 Tax=Flavilitoribacter nigricans (strain ATCC 23147 / DSM 23189 / NBRC 102662 / NCIMB 1420 / SS-2) TaxID=1122177 RepID=A0A2D0NAA0_FLAN2|nr:DUF4340 domain-containing protein [Flavilitoribacter nigricans]PHN05306.1 hypothetical protein CRP01_17470 [Flavilitoribacter nigricans DSM 23189 = NBRC 102662]